MTRVKISPRRQSFEDEHDTDGEGDTGWQAIAIAGVLVDGPGRNSFDEETYAGYCEGGYARCVGWSLYHRYHVGILALVSYQYLTLSSTYLQLLNVGGGGGVSGGGL